MNQQHQENAQAGRKKNTLKAIIGGSAGNLVEWYDWYAYSAFSLYFAESFFPRHDLTAQLLNTAGIFAVGFLMRPVGGWLFGRIADRSGRKKAMTSSVLLMSFGSLIIAVSPSYDSAGIVAPVLLLLARLLQGLSVGGEYGTSATYLSEIAFEKRRGFYSSFQYVTLIGGQLIALGLLLLLQQFFLTSAQLHEWGWRIPFFLGAFLSLIALYLRSSLEETDAYKNKVSSGKKRGTIKELLRHPRAIITVIGLTLGGTIAFYTFSTYMQKFLVNTVQLSKDDATLLTFSCLLIFALLQPLFGLLSDRIGRRPLLLAFGLLGSVFTVPILYALSRAESHYLIFGLMMFALIIVSGYTSINAVVKAELFPAEVRALGVGLPYAITVAIFGGSAEYIALYLKNSGHENWYFWFVSCCIFISLIVYVRMKDTREHSLIEKDR
jgi:MFS transporter, MHS family, alpha-ketoglutarate permease